MGSKIDDAKGRAKEALGAVTDDSELKQEGKADRVGAKVKDAAETAKDKVADAVDAVTDRFGNKND